MSFRKLFRTICFAALNVALVSTLAAPAAQKREASKEIRSKLFKQVMAEYKDMRECVEQEEGGAQAAEEGTTVEEVDLDRDGVPEYEVQLSSPCACGMVNCMIFMYRQSPRGYESILVSTGLGVDLLKTSSNGYVDLRVEARDTAATRVEVTYKFNGKQYGDVSSRIVQVETGESKPAHLRVRFKRGASSTRVQGKVSIALPDTYLVGARAGQVMTVEITVGRREIRFMVMSPSSRSLLADNTRSWTGTLPETGDYQIIVDADEKGWDLPDDDQRQMTGLQDSHD